METKKCVDEEMDVEMEFDQKDLIDIYRLKEAEEQYGTLIKAKSTLPNVKENHRDTFNILMADASASMDDSWPIVTNSWNTFIKPKLIGTTKIYKFHHEVIFLRNTTELFKEDIRGSGGTNITKALKVLRREIDNCNKSFVRVFIITDGGHNRGKPLPEEEIRQMSAPPGKTVYVYLLGITLNFPVNYSLDIRSNLHNGSSNMPSLYWAKYLTDITNEMEVISRDLNINNVKMSLNYEGYILPGLESTSSLQIGEWIYIPKPPEVMVDLKITIDTEEWERPQEVREADVSTLLDSVFPQWNSVLIQQHRKKLHVPKETFKFMDSLFTVNLSAKKNRINGVGCSVKDRLERKMFKTYEVKYTTLMNMSRSVIEVEGKYADEMELAKNILKSTVSGRKYDTKNLNIRGHGLDDFDRDIEELRKVYIKIQGDIMELPAPDPEDCCRITISSTLSDLQDPDFMLLLDEGKFELLRNFTITGIPAYAPVRDASQINVWTLSILHMLVTPFTILSQRAIEEKASIDDSDNNLGFIDKDIKLKDDDETSRFNIIIPIVPAYAANVLKPIVRSNVYSILATFCILKNPHIIDHNAHLAALACAWVRSIADHPLVNRPGYIKDRLAAIVATAEIYMERKSVQTYLNALYTDPQQALMTESTKEFNDRTIKCESLVKPLFFLSLRKKDLTQSQLQMLLSMLIGEFIGRCLSNYDNSKNATPFTDFFGMTLKDPKTKEEWTTKTIQSIKNEFKTAHNQLLKEFYAPENVLKAVKKFIISRRAICDRKIKFNDKEFNMEKVKHLRNIASCGDVRFYTFKNWAQEMSIPEEEIEAAYSPSSILVHVCQALLCRNSRDRLSRKPRSYEECVKTVETHLNKENSDDIFEDMREKLTEFAMSEWREEYMRVHKAVVLPLSPEQIVTEAQRRGVEVTLETFSQKYKYNAECKLLRNACQIPGCPYYLVPRRNFNQHLSAERIPGVFPHALHLVSKEKCDGSVDEVLEEIIEGTYSGRQGRNKCPISEQQSLCKLATEIENLIHIYKEGH